ncbi:DUF3108 domain-containing protein [Allochromatium humboldtianum]|uniref:DUF3108 domain-containing protein n=1 Tax=Allochromatium humboldtianum TaxID=504901 RepID=A0A850RGN1_9GAMM|nr:DUF3108 domain-containing protein [Allochromatium humboldtianum]NVZ11346.1 DUF3108 domain-containing protein [Allochromatium humboldtianum]
MSLETPRLYVALLVVLGISAAFAWFHGATTEAATANWSSRITPLVWRPDAEIRPLNLSYEVSWSQWLRAGSLQIAFDPKPGAQGGLVEARARARSLGPVRVFWPYESSTRAEISRRTLQPSRFEHVKTESGERQTYRATYRNGSMSVESVLRSGDGRDVERETRTHEFGQIRDVLSTLLFLQQIDLSQRRTVTLLVQPLDRLYLVSFRVAGQESRRVFEKTWKTIKLAVEIRRVSDDLELASYTKMRSATLWLSDDHRIPVEIQADLQVGFVSMRLRRLG